jgi:hypothetical protein
MINLQKVPLGLKAYKDWEKGLEAAREENKPIPYWILPGGPV